MDQIEKSKVGVAVNGATDKLNDGLRDAFNVSAGPGQPVVQSPIMKFGNMVCDPIMEVLTAPADHDGHSSIKATTDRLVNRFKDGRLHQKDAAENGRRLANAELLRTSIEDWWN